MVTMNEAKKMRLSLGHHIALMSTCLSIILACQLVDTTKITNNIIFDRIQPFQVEATLRISKGSDAYGVKTIESYSPERNVARIEEVIYPGDGSSQPRIIYKDEQGYLNFRPDNKMCETSVNATYQTRFGKYLNLTDPKDDQLYVGLASRALIYFTQETRNMSLTYLSLTSLVVYTQVSDEWLKIGLLYRKDASANYKETTPLQMQIEFIEPKELVEILYEPVRPIPDREISSWLEWDHFSVNPQEGMIFSPQCRLERQARFARGHELETTQFSFKFRMLGVNFEPRQDVTRYNGRVAFDSRLQVMRVDKQGANEATLLRRMFNFKLNKRYLRVMLDDKSAFLDRGQPIKYEPKYKNLESTIMMQTIIGRPNERLKPSAKMLPPLGELLFGADDFVDLGRAWLRGIRVRVLESRGAKIPFWFQQETPLVSGKSATTRPSDPRGDSLYNLRVFISETSDPRDIGAPVAIQYEGWGSTRGTRVTIEFYDFFWANDHLDLLDEFSLIQAYPQPYIVTSWTNFSSLELPVQEFLVDMKLGSGALEGEIHYLHDTSTRDRVLLYSLENQLNWPLEYINDFSSKLILDLNKPDVSSIFLQSELSFPKGLNFIMTGQLSTDRATLRVQTSWPDVREFEICQSLAIATETSKFIMLAYDYEKSECYVMARKSAKQGSGSDSRTLEDLDSHVEIYNLTLSGKDVMDSSCNQFHASLGDAQNMKKTALLLEDLTYKRRDAIKFTIEELIVDEIDEGLDGGIDSDGSRPISFPRLGYLDQPKLNRLITREDIGNSTVAAYDTNYEVTLERCRAAALANDDIKSYSFCLRPDNVRCVLSKLDLMANDTLARQFQDASQSAGTSKVTIELSLFDPDSGANQTVIQELERNLNCELHDINYLALYEAHSEAAFRPLDEQERKSARPVSYGIDECARLCFEANQRDHLVDLENRKSLTEAHDLLKEWRSYRSRDRLICEHFDFLPVSELPGDREQIPKNVTGFCLLDPACIQMDDEQHDFLANLDEQEVRIARYLTKFESFFEAQEGIRMMPSGRADQMQEIKMIRDSLLKPDDDKVIITPEQANLIKTFVKDGGNFQERVHVTSVKECALSCLSSQRVSPWPGCRSLTIIKKKSDSDEIDCFHNTVSMRDSERGPMWPPILIDKASNAGRRSFHYEFQLGYRVKVSPDWNKKPSGSSWWILLIIISGGLVCGLLIGLKGTKILLNRRARRRPSMDDDSRLVPSI